MKCTKCIEHKWMDAQESVYTDTLGIEYCEFHAPSGHKGISNGAFEKNVVARITSILDVDNKENTTSLCDFSGTIFPCEIFFHIRKFNLRLPEISFEHCIFEGKAHFEFVNFEYRARFSYAVFMDVACFTASVFAKDAGFVRTEFCFAEFHGAVFTGKAVFSKTVFSNNVTFFGCEAGNNKIIIHDVDTNCLGNMDFTSREIESIDFIECRFGVALKPDRTGLHFRAEELYRSLKNKAARRHDQPMVSEWHYREKMMALAQLRMKPRWKPWKSVTWWYYWCSGFGERPVRAWWVLVGICLVPLAIFGGTKIVETGFSWHPDWPKIGEVLDEWRLCTPFIKVDAKECVAAGNPDLWKIRIAWLFQILIAIQATLFGFALHNRFRR